MLQKLVGSMEFKIVVVDAPLVNPNTSCVWINQRQAQIDVARKTILENNAKKVLYITGKKNGYVTEERLLGMKQLAEELGISTTRVNDFVSGKSEPNLKTAGHICRFLKIRPAAMLML